MDGPGWIFCDRQAKVALRKKIAVSSRKNFFPVNTKSLFMAFHSLLRRIHVHPLSRYPFTDIGRAVSEFGSVRFADRQEFYGLAVREKDVFEIDGHCARFLFQQATKHGHILRCNPSADAQDHKVLSDNMAVDSAAHCRFTFEPLYS